MYSTLAATTDAEDALESRFLFGQSSDDPISMPVAHENFHLKASASPMVPISGLHTLMYRQYSESAPSSTHYGDSHDISEVSGGHNSGREDHDGSISSGYVNGKERSHAPSPLHYPHPTKSAQRNGMSNGTSAGLFKNSKGDHAKFAATNGLKPTSATPLQHPNNVPAFTQNSMATPFQVHEWGLRASSTPELSQSQEPSGARRCVNPSPTKGKGVELRANASIPAALSWEEFARQSILAAESSRLNPFALHPSEYKLLRHHITHAQVTIYLNIRNGILRLWTRNPLVHVSLEEAAGCAREKRYFGLAEVTYHWLSRNGYINFGCVDVPTTAAESTRSRTKAEFQRTVVVVGAGMSGLGCARQLEGLFSQYGSQWTDEGERPPKVIVLEARRRVGGRVYSHPLRNQSSSVLPPGHRCTAEMGAQIVTGFEHGNPMNAIIRGQLGIPYHGLRDNTILYDHDGTIVEKEQDLRVEKLYNDVLERASVFRNKPSTFRTVEGDRNLILFGRDPSDNGGPTIATLEQSNTPLPANAKTTASTTEEKPSSGVEKLAGRAYQLTAGFNPNVSAAESVTNMGWYLRPQASFNHALDLDPIAKSSEYPTLGQIMDDGIKQYQNLIDLKPRDLRLLNWHHANLEYANAVSVNQLSLSGWDQDIGNEFEGEHTEIIGGYQQVPRGLWQCPSKLDVRFNSAVRTILYDPDERTVGKAVQVVCHNGETIEADEVVLTTPLGVLKSGSIKFQPPLPDWKQNVIERMGFGLLNKVSMPVCKSLPLI
jgi:lysine-specific histone demethylase 1